MDSSGITTDFQFILTDTTKNDNVSNINFDFYETVLYLNQYEKTPVSGGFIKIPYFMPSSTIRPNIQYITTPQTQSYQCSKLSIYQKSHPLSSDVQYDGELVIECTPITNSYNKLFVCFLLQNTLYLNSTASDIDKVIADANNNYTRYTTMNFNLGQYVAPTQPVIVYTSGVDTVLIFTQPIQIQNVDFSTFSTIGNDVMALYPTDMMSYSVVSMAPSSDNTTIRDSFTEGFTKNVKRNKKRNVAGVFDCKMIDMKDPSGKKTEGSDTATYLMDSSVSEQQSAMGVAFALFNFFAILLAAYFGSPPIFKLMFIDVSDDGNQMMFGASIFVLLATIMSFILMINGVGYDHVESGFGIFMLLFLALSIMSVVIKMNDKVFLTPSGQGKQPFNVDIDDFFASFGSLFENFFTTLRRIISDNLFPKEGDIGIAWTYVILFIALSIPSLVISAKKDKNANKKEKHKPGYINNLVGIVMGIGCVYGLFAILYIYYIKGRM